MNGERVAPAEMLSVSQCWALLRSVEFGRLAVTADGAPDIFPVNHLVDHGTLLFRTAVGTKLEAATGHAVAFEVDGRDAETDEAWSVVVKGRAHAVDQLHEVIEAVGQPLFPWHEGAKPYFLRIEPELITGRRFPVRHP